MIITEDSTSECIIREIRDMLASGTNTYESRKALCKRLMKHPMIKEAQDGTLWWSFPSAPQTSTTIKVNINGSWKHFSVDN
jgi:hypothetical protein